MSTIEVRLHSLRVKPAKGLSASGLTLARDAASTFGGAFSAYYTGPARRCRETLEAMGFPVYEERDVFGALPNELDGFERELTAQQLATGCRYMDGYLAIPGARAILQERGQELVSEVHRLAKQLLAAGRALVISHAETIELLWMAARAEGAPGFPGGELRPLDGVAIDVVDERIRQVRVVRLPGEPGAAQGG